MKFIALAAITACLTAPAWAQDITVPNVTTASPGGYANPLKLDTDRYDRENGKASTKRPPAPHGRCNDKPLTEAERTALDVGYWELARAKSHHEGWRWLDKQCGASNAIQLQRKAKRNPPS